MAIEINCKPYEKLSEKELGILDSINARLSSVSMEMGEEEIKSIIKTWMERLQAAFLEPFQLKRLKQKFTGKVSEEEDGLLKRWEPIRNIWGYWTDPYDGEHNFFEKITHCNVIPIQCWTDIIMRILYKKKGFERDCREKSGMALAEEGIKENDGKNIMGYAIWSVYFENPEVLPLLQEICSYELSSESSYTMVNLVLFTQAWIEHCLFRKPKPLLKQINSLDEIYYNQYAGGGAAYESGDSSSSSSEKSPSPKRPALRSPGDDDDVVFLRKVHVVDDSPTPTESSPKIHQTRNEFVDGMYSTRVV